MFKNDCSGQILEALNSLILGLELEPNGKISGDVILFYWEFNLFKYLLFLWFDSMFILQKDLKKKFFFGRNQRFYNLKFSYFSKENFTDKFWAFIKFV